VDQLDVQGSAREMHQNILSGIRRRRAEYSTRSDHPHPSDSHTLEAQPSMAEENEPSCNVLGWVFCNYVQLTPPSFAFRVEEFQRSFL
jgi:hypothetical protein